MNENLKALSEDFFQNSLSTSPTSAMMRGYKEYFDQLEELTDETFEEEAQRVARERRCSPHFGEPVVHSGQICSVHAYAVGVRREEAGCDGEALVVVAALGEAEGGE